MPSFTSPLRSTQSYTVENTLWALVNLFMDLLFLMRFLYYVVADPPSPLLFALSGSKHSDLYARVLQNVYGVTLMQTFRNTKKEPQLSTKNLSVHSYLLSLIE